jgi:hypothetical protein
LEAISWAQECGTTQKKSRPPATAALKEDRRTGIA